jgi:desulfoferrodoxin (superoxide reductase-like protein)
MKELVPGEVDAAVEKHVPAVTIDGVDGKNFYNIY